MVSSISGAAISDQNRERELKGEHNSIRTAKCGMTPHYMLRRLAPDLFVAERPLRFYGVEVGTRMTAIRLSDSSLFVHSPVALDRDLRRELESLGTPRFAVAPNRLHHLFAGQYTAAYSELQLFVAPGLERKRPDLSIAGILSDEVPAGWNGQIDQEIVRGYPMLNEVVFFHRSSRTLLCSDLVFNVREDSPPVTRWLTWLIGGYKRFGPTALEKFLIRDRGAARQSLNRLLSWDFDRVILAHGQILESGGREAMRRGYAWLL